MFRTIISVRPTNYGELAEVLGESNSLLMTNQGTVHRCACGTVEIVMEDADPADIEEFVFNIVVNLGLEVAVAVIIML